LHFPHADRRQAAASEGEGREVEAAAADVERHVIARDRRDAPRRPGREEVAAVGDRVERQRPGDPVVLDPARGDQQTPGREGPGVVVAGLDVVPRAAELPGVAGPCGADDREPLLDEALEDRR
jgi:hypothetical protein